MKDKTCPICGITFSVKDSHFGKRITCSKGCMKIHYRTALVGPKNPHWKGGKIPLNCLTCGKEFFVIPANATKSKYCSHECLAESQRKHRTQKPPKERVIRRCKLCHFPIKKGRFYCSKCSPKNRGKIITYCHSCNKEIVRYKKGIGNISFCGDCRKASTTGSNNPNWRGGLKTLNDTIRSSDKMKLWIKEVLQRNNYLCFYCKSTGNLHAHHIFPFSAIIESYKFYNGKLDLPGIMEYPVLWDVNNGIALCPSCHRKFPNRIKDETLSIPPELLERALTNGIRIVARSLEDVIEGLELQDRFLIRTGR